MIVRGLIAAGMTWLAWHLFWDEDTKEHTDAGSNPVSD